MCFLACWISVLKDFKTGEASDFTSPKRLKTLSILSTISFEIQLHHFFQQNREGFGKWRKEFLQFPICSVRFLILIKAAFSNLKFSICITFEFCFYIFVFTKRNCVWTLITREIFGSFFKVISASSILKVWDEGFFLPLWRIRIRRNFHESNFGNSNSCKFSLVTCTMQR